MRAVVQRAKRAQVSVEHEIKGKINKGLVIFLGVSNEDNISDVKYLAEKIINLRIFEDDEGKLNQSVEDIKGEILLISQFTLYGDTRKGRRPSFTDAATPEIADKLYNEFLEHIKIKGIHVETGVFQAYMEVELVNDGPVTMLLDSKKNF